MLIHLLPLGIICFGISSLYCTVEKRVAFVATCSLYCVLVVTVHIKGGNMTFECIGSYEVLRLAIGAVMSANIVQSNMINGVRFSYKNMSFIVSSLH